MLLNIVLILLVFGASKKRVNPLISVSALCAIKVALYFVATRSLTLALGNGLVFGVLAFSFALLLRRILNKPAREPVYATVGSKASAGKFEWEYIPLAIIFVLLVFGEMIAAFFLSGQVPIG